VTDNLDIILVSGSQESYSQTSHTHHTYPLPTTNSTPISHKQPPAICPNHTPRHIPIIQNRQITLRHILRLPRPSRRTLLPHLQHHLLSLLIAHLPQRRINHAWTNAIDLY
jgi:hypothetical protein